MKKMLITCTELMLLQFLLPHVLHLSERGYRITLACSEVAGRFSEVRALLPELEIHRLPLHRNPLHPGNLLGYPRLKAILKEDFQIIWTNEPVVGALTRLAARGHGAKVLYLCHGFHFFRGSRWRNWLWYPVERLLARWTDRIVTISREDYEIARTMAPAARLHGIGAVKKSGDRESLRRELGLGPGDRLALCVGELNRNKDQATALWALARTGEEIHLALCGTGPREKQLRTLARQLRIGSRVHLLGYRQDMGNVYAAADLLLHPSRREGLGLVLLEGMLAGLPTAGCRIRGVREICPNLVEPGDRAGFAEFLKHPGEPEDPEKFRPYLLENVLQEMERLLDAL